MLKAIQRLGLTYSYIFFSLRVLKILLKIELFLSLRLFIKFSSLISNSLKIRFAIFYLFIDLQEL